MTIKLDPESYAEFFNLDLDYVLEHWDEISLRLELEVKTIFG